jgi:1-acyl-sn-glycerol-3-phosphate acyltransferase
LARRRQKCKPNGRLKEVENIMKALDNGWVISFPQGTTSAYAQGRKGTAKLVQQQRSIVIPIKINGFRRAFDKKVSE